MTELARVREAVSRHGTNQEALVPLLREIDQTLGHLTTSSLDEVSRLLRVPPGHVYAVATFYRMLSLEPRGRHVVQFCENAPCHVAGGLAVWNAIRDALGLEAGETSKDGQWTLRTTSCIGLCDIAPVLLVDGDLYGNVRAEQVREILARYEEPPL